MSRNAHIEESLLKFFYGECSVEELKEIHKELCSSDDCHEYLDSITELLHLLKSAEDTSKADRINWDELKCKFDRVLSVIDKSK